MDLFNELKRRKVVRVLIAYAIGAWALVQVAATAFPLLDIPETYARYVLIAALAGFPIAAVLAWMFDLTPGGVRRTTEADAADPRWPTAYRVAATVLAVAIIGAGALATARPIERARRGP